jgi:hypothetical protein
MECPSCGLAVLIEAGKIATHLRPQDMTVCNGRPPTASKSDDTPPTHKPPAKKAAPAKKTAAHTHTQKK